MANAFSSRGICSLFGRSRLMASTITREQLHRRASARRSVDCYRQRCLRARHRQAGHGHPFQRPAFSPDGRPAGRTGSQGNGDLVLIDASNWKVLKVATFNGDVKMTMPGSLLFTGDGKHIVLGAPRYSDGFRRLRGGLREHLEKRAARDGLCPSWHRLLARRDPGGQRWVRRLPGVRHHAGGAPP